MFKNEIKLFHLFSDKNHQKLNNRVVYKNKSKDKDFIKLKI